MTIITIDGPSGVGKGTVAMALAQELGFDFLDSGALYRLVALQALRHHVSLEDETQLAELATLLPVVFLPSESGSGVRILLSGEEVNSEIRTEEVASVASKVAALPKVREALLVRQRAFAKGKDLIADGRDMGTVVFPQAALKIFLTASAQERAKRRYLQLQKKSDNVNINNILRDIVLRDARDKGRADSPLIPAQDAMVLDSSNMDAKQVLLQVKKLIDGRGLKKVH